MCTSDVVVDAYAGAGGNTIQFAQKCQFDNNLERLTTILQPNTRVYGVEARVDYICGDVTGVLRALRTEPISPVDTVFMSPPWGGPGYTKGSRLLPGSSSWNKNRRREMILEAMTNPCPEIFDIDGQIPELVVCLRGMNILGFEKGGGTTVGGQSVVVTPRRLFLPPALHSCVMPDFKFWSTPNPYQTG
nr:hypothetical transcript [Hymenolepis microstoma]